MTAPLPPPSGPLASSPATRFLDRDDALHHAADAAIREIVGRQRLLVSVVTYAEVMTGARLGHHDPQNVRGFFSQLISEVLPVDVAVTDRAAELPRTPNRCGCRMPGIGCESTS